MAIVVEGTEKLRGEKGIAVSSFVDSLCDDSDRIERTVQGIGDKMRNILLA